MQETTQNILVWSLYINVEGLHQSNITEKVNKSICRSGSVLIAVPYKQMNQENATN